MMTFVRKISFFIFLFALPSFASENPRVPKTENGRLRIEGSDDRPEVDDDEQVTPRVEDMPDDYETPSNTPRDDGREIFRRAREE